MTTTGDISLGLELQSIVSNEQAWHYRIIPKDANEERYTFWIDETSMRDGLSEELEILLGKDIELHNQDPELINRSLNRYYPAGRGVVQGASSQQKISSLQSGSSELLEKLVLEARTLKSSDIHIETYEESCRIRFRIDGLLVERYSISKSEYPSLINKIKIKSNMDIAEKRLPQDGRVFFNAGGAKFDIRVSVLPTLYGEKAVLRLLNHDATDINIHKIGFSEASLGEYMKGIKKSQGIVLISGPTGSGKTTTLYATLKVLNETTDNIITAEDPIEYTLDGINQVQLKESIGLTFAGALRTFLRQDPDVIMVGEIRDAETAEIAIRAALTGHLVLSTIHTNSAWGTISRLIDMGVAPYLLANTLNTSVAQRLVRTLCPACKKKVAFTKDSKEYLHKSLSRIEYCYESVGCEQCYYTGYKGRKAVYEVISIDTELAECIKNQNSSVDAILSDKNIPTLAKSAWQLFVDGDTSYEEIYPILLSNN